MAGGPTNPVTCGKLPHPASSYPDGLVTDNVFEMERAPEQVAELTPGSRLLLMVRPIGLALRARLPLCEGENGGVKKKN